MAKRFLALKHWSRGIKWQKYYNGNTLPETNIAPENGPSPKETGIPTIHFQVLLLLVSGRVHYFDNMLEILQLFLKLLDFIPLEKKCWWEDRVSIRVRVLFELRRIVLYGKFAPKKLSRGLFSHESCQVSLELSPFPLLLWQMKVYRNPLLNMK